jgi:hypothetical protein
LAAHVRGLLGRGFSVADEEGALDGKLRLIIVRRGKTEVLVVELADTWLRSLQGGPCREDRILLKHLAICARRYFLYPYAVAESVFIWPGTVESRGKLRLALDPRRHRKA